MTKEQAIQIFIKHSTFFDLYARDKYVPRAMEGTLNELKAAYKAFNPNFNDCGNCQQTMEMIVSCNKIRLAEIERLKKVENKVITQMTFPKHKKKK